jgi:hypothetical protein
METNGSKYSLDSLSLEANILTRTEADIFFKRFMGQSNIFSESEEKTSIRFNRYGNKKRTVIWDTLLGELIDVFDFRGFQNY